MTAPYAPSPETTRRVRSRTASHTASFSSCRSSEDMPSREMGSAISSPLVRCNDIDHLVDAFEDLLPDVLHRCPGGRRLGVEDELHDALVEQMAFLGAIRPGGSDRCVPIGLRERILDSDGAHKQKETRPIAGCAGLSCAVDFHWGIVRVQPSRDVMEFGIRHGFVHRLHAPQNMPCLVSDRCPRSLPAYSGDCPVVKAEFGETSP